MVLLTPSPRMRSAVQPKSPKAVRRQKTHSINDNTKLWLSCQCNIDVCVAVGKPYRFVLKFYLCSARSFAGRALGMMLIVVITHDDNNDHDNVDTYDDNADDNDDDNNADFSARMRLL